MNKTQIEWAQNPDGTSGYTWNPITGCLNNCDYCYARRLANTRLRDRYLSNKNYASYDGLPHGFGYTAPEVDPFYPRFWEDRLKEPLYPSKSLGIFTCDMSDLFGIGIPEAWTQRVMDTIKKCPDHRFYLLTKQPQNLIKFSPFPDNCWVGVSVTDFQQFALASMHLSDVKASVKFYSFEPLLSEITDHHNQYKSKMMARDFTFAGIQWVIIGAQTKPYRPPKTEWVREIVEACDKAEIPVFLKDNLKPLIIQAAYRGVVGDDYVLEGKLRQEMPKYQHSIE